MASTGTARCIAQLTHMGRRGTSALSGVPLRSPSDLPEGVHLEVPVPLAVPEIDAIVGRFAEAARRLERCGWDGAEVTSFGGHLIEQFFDPGVNRRTDAYGGSLENRTRFGREVLAAVRAAVGDGFIVGFRMAGDQCLTGGLGPDELIEVARSLAAGGAIDILSVSGGTGATRSRRRTSCRRTSCRRGSTTRSRGASARPSACPCSSRGATSSSRWRTRASRAASTSSR